MLKKYLNPKILILITIIIGIVLFFTFNLGSLFTFESLKSNQASLKSFVSENYLIAVFSYILIYILVITFALPGAAITTLAGGALFGFFGVVFVNIAASVGASSSFYFSRYIAGDSIQGKYETQLSKINKNISANELSYLFFLRFVPVFPFFLVNVLSGLSKVKFKNFLISTSLGTLPGTFVYVYAGLTLSEIDNPSEIISLEVLGVFLLFGLISLVPIIFKKKFKQFKN